MSDRSALLDISRGHAWPLSARSRRSRLAETAAAVAEACGCRVPMAGVLRGFNRSERHEASALRRRLGAYGVRSVDIPVALTDETVAGQSGRYDQHVCVLLEATGQRIVEAERAAARAGVPIVTAAGGERAGRGNAELEERPVLRTAFLGRQATATFPSVAGEIADVALDEVRVVPNQPETGEIRVTVGGAMPRVLPAGTELRVRPLPGPALVEARSPGSEPVTWMTAEVLLEQVSGIHTVHRDGVCFTDLDGKLSIRSQKSGLRSYTV